jgi:hypothetical protein
MGNRFQYSPEYHLAGKQAHANGEKVGMMMNDDIAVSFPKGVQVVIAIVLPIPVGLFP